eukprot:gene2853-3146_t
MGLEGRLRSTYEAISSSTARKLPVQVVVSGSLGELLQVQLTDADGNCVAASTDPVVLQAASSRPMTSADVESAVGQLGDNTLTPAGIDLSGLDLEQGLFLPASAFKAVRRAAAEQLLNLRLQHQYAKDLAQQMVPWVPEVILDFLEAHGLKEALSAVQSSGKQAVVALPRIMKPDESRLLGFYLQLGADALLLRGAGCLQQLLELGLSRLCPTHDLNAAQLAVLAEGLRNPPAAGAAARQGSQEPDTNGARGHSSSRAGQLEVIVHQHLPIFHTEHCVFCRNTVFNASAQSGLYHIPRLVKAGYGCLRVELVDEAPEVVQELLEGYRAVLDGSRRPGEVWQWLKGVTAGHGGVGAGSLEVKAERAAASLRPSARR